MQLSYLLAAIAVIFVAIIGAFWVLPVILLAGLGWPNWQASIVQAAYLFILGTVAWQLFQKARGKDS